MMGDSEMQLMDPSEVEFFAEKELLTIIPNFSLDKIYLISVSDNKELLVTFPIVG